MATSILLEEQLEIPLDLRSLADFRRWTFSETFPERSRIDYLAGRIEVDMSPEDFFCHGTLKTEVVRVLSQRIKRQGLGYLVADQTRVSSVEADLSVEPDVVFLSHETLAGGLVRLVPKVGGEPGRYVEVEGAPDLIVEIVSDRSVEKDTRRLPAAYFQAGVREFWLADARKPEVLLVIHTRGKDGFHAVGQDAQGYQASAVFGCGFRLEATCDAHAHRSFDLLESPSA